MRGGFDGETTSEQRWLKIYDGADGISPDFCTEVIRFFEESTRRHKLNQPWQRYHQLTNLHQTPLYEEVRANIERILLPASRKSAREQLEIRACRMAALRRNRTRLHVPLFT